MGGSEKSKTGAGKIHTDGRGRSVWAETVNTAKFELVTTQELRTILESTDDPQRESIEQVAAASSDEGVLARNADTGLFQIIDETSLREILGRETQPASQPADVTLEPLQSDDETSDLSLVSTQALRRMIRPAAAGSPDEEVLEADVIDTGGFDPYNSS